MRAIASYQAYRPELTSICSWRTRAKWILDATRQHATTLATFATLYKSLLLLLRKARGGKQGNPDSLIAGLIASWAVFKDRTSVNEQVRGLEHGVAGTGLTNMTLS